ncbi:hypothetical protein HOA91_02165 [Candidatus Woesearchaeota archaeon]|jgi:hypothetical protein|nr:hypothetical protein [Candidatus Woesearchaeota archaeon]MBT6995753.1 hypothetical protein [Candidatus Woesearchaeota archaeon]
MKSTLKKKSLEDSLSDHTAQVIESESRVEVVGEGEFKELLRKGERFLKTKLPSVINDDDFNEKHAIATWKITETLTPKNINKFLQLCVCYENMDLYNPNTGFLISRLIRNSYHKGHRTFNFDISGLNPIDQFGSFLKGKERKQIKVNVVGDLGYEPFQDVEYGVFCINGNVRGLCGMGAKNSKFIINGNSGIQIGHDSERCTFVLNGEDHSRSYSNHLLSNTFKTPNKKTLNILLDEVCSGNRIVYIHSNGKEEVVRSYSK